MNRLQVMLAVRASHNEEYYKQAALSKGVSIQELTHPEIAAFKAAMDAIEADIIIEISAEQEKTSVSNLKLHPSLCGN